MATNGAPESWDEEPATVTSSFKAFNLDDLDDFVPSFVPQAAQPAYEEPVAPEPAAPAPKPEPVKPAAVSTSSAAKEKGPDSASPSPVLTRQSTDPAAAARAADKAAQEAALIEKEDAEYKEHLNIVFIGHVDAGKSTMGGHILYLTGMVDKRTMEKYEKEAKELGRESWFLSWALDANAEERAKGKTVEYGRGYFETAKRRFTILDAPGHKNFVPSMISGASQADVAVLVISARKGEFETGFEKGGQTREHAMLVKTTGVKKIVVAVNKMDDPTVMWSKERYEEIIGKIVPFLKGVGFNPKTDVECVPISGFSGANLKDRAPASVCSYYQGPSLLELLDDMEIPRKTDGTLLITVADRYKDMGTVVLGKVESGRVRKGQTVMLMPNKKTTEIIGIAMEETELTSARVGDSVRLRLKNVEEDEIQPGFVICDPSRPVHYTNRFDAQVNIVEFKSIMAAGYQCVLHLGSSTEEVSISDLLHKVDKKTGKRTKLPPQFLKQGDSAIVRIEVAENVCVETYAEHPNMGRFTLRDEGRTVAIGKVTKIHESV